MKRPPTRAPAGPTPAIPATNADRRAQEAAAARRAARAAGASREAEKAAYEARNRAARDARVRPVLSRGTLAQPGAPRAGLPPLPAALAARRAFRGEEDVLGEEDMLGALMGETNPTIGQAVMSHPFQALLIGTALFGVGALVGKERIVDAGLAIGDAVTGTAHGAIRGARERRVTSR